jgi:nicotinamidase-related amidase
VSAAGRRVQPGRTAIVAVDFQHDIVGADGAFAPMFHAEVRRTNVIPTAARLLAGARTLAAKIVYIRAAFQPGYRDLVAIWHHRGARMSRRRHGRHGHRGPGRAAR